jgi:hypothetical protein
VFIVWRRRPVTTERRTTLFAPDGISFENAWKPLFCDHRGPGRVSHIPCLMHSRRVDGQPRQQLLYRLPAIRSCCATDPLIRAAWWREVERLLDSFESDPASLAVPYDAASRTELIAGLVTAVARPSDAELAAFADYRRPFEEEFRKARETPEERARRKAEEYQRRQREQEEEWRRQWEELLRGYTAPAPSSDAWWSVLGVSPQATLREVEDRYRVLGKQLHPDVHFDGGKAFLRTRKAYQEALDTLPHGQ